MTALYVIFDRLAEEGGPVFQAKNDAVAVRSFRQVMGQRAAGRDDEYRLFCVGEYDSDALSVHGIPKREVVVPVEVERE